MPGWLMNGDRLEGSRRIPDAIRRPARRTADDHDMPLISVVIPVYCEEAVIEQTYRELSRVMGSLAPRRYELIFVDDGSTDRTAEILRALAAGDRRVRVLFLSRNFGHQAAMTAGMRRARGAAVVTVDGDLQDPPCLIPDMVAAWERGHDVVHGVRAGRRGDTWFKRATATLFYRLLNRVAGVPIQEDAGEFRLLDRRVVAELNGMGEHSRFVRGLVSWVGFRQTTVEYVREPRRAGRTKYPLAKMMRLAWDAVVSFSDAPLRAVLTLGFGAVVVAFAVLGYGLVQHWRGETVRGWTSTMVTILFLGGVQLLTLGVIGQYLSRMYEELKGRPLYVVRDEINFDDDAG